MKINSAQRLKITALTVRRSSAGSYTVTLGNGRNFTLVRNPQLHGWIYYDNNDRSVYSDPYPTKGAALDDLLILENERSS